MILVTGFPGNVAVPLANALASRNLPFRVAVRPGRLARAQDPLDVVKDAGVMLSSSKDTLQTEVVPFDFTLPETFSRAFEGIRSMFLVRPPALSNVVRDIIPALEAACTHGVQHVVFLSIQGAEKNTFVPHYAIEQWLLSSGMTWSFIRAAYFVQNIFTTHGPELASGEIFLPAGNGKTSFVDVEDVAEVSCYCLTDPEKHKNTAYTVTGPEALTYDDVAAILTREWGREVKYVQPWLPHYWMTLSRRGVPHAMIAVTVGIYTVARMGWAADVSDDVKRVTGREARTAVEVVRRTPPVAA